MNREELLREIYQKYFKLYDEGFSMWLPPNFYFAIEFSDNTIGYVMNHRRSFYDPNILVFLNKDDFIKQDLVIRNSFKRDQFGMFEAYTKQSLLEIGPESKGKTAIEGTEAEYKRFGSKYGKSVLTDRQVFIDITEFEAGNYPHKIHSTEKLEKLNEALDACLLCEDLPIMEDNFFLYGGAIPLAKKVDGEYVWSETEMPRPGEGEAFIEAAFDDDELASSLRALPSQAGSAQRISLVQWPIPAPIPSGLDSHYYPMALFKEPAEREGRKQRVLMGGPYSEEELPPLLVKLAGELIREGAKPERLLASDDRTLLFLKDFCQKAGIDLVDIRGTDEDSLWPELIESFSEAITRPPKAGKADVIELQLPESSLKPKDQSVMEESLKDTQWYLPVRGLSASGKRMVQLESALRFDDFSGNRYINQISKIRKPIIEEGGSKYIFSAKAGRGRTQYFEVSSFSSIDDLMAEFFDELGLPSFNDGLAEAYVCMDNRDTNVYKYMCCYPKMVTEPPSFRGTVEFATLTDLIFNKGQQFKCFYETKDGKKGEIQFEVMDLAPMDDIDMDSLTRISEEEALKGY